MVVQGRPAARESDSVALRRPSFRLGTEQKVDEWVEAGVGG